MRLLLQRVRLCQSLASASWSAAASDFDSGTLNPGRSRHSYVSIWEITYSFGPVRRL